jgi:hypothetical protein
VERRRLRKHIEQLQRYHEARAQNGRETFDRQAQAGRKTFDRQARDARKISGRWRDEDIDAA